jgi:DNA-binding YbaB/EbfC family protein
MFKNLGNIAELMKGTKKIQEMMEKTQSELEKIEVHGESAAGAVKVRMSAKFYVKHIHIDEDLLKEDKDVLQDLIAAAINNAVDKATEITQSKMMNVSSIFSSLKDDSE